MLHCFIKAYSLTEPPSFYSFMGAQRGRNLPRARARLAGRGPAGNITSQITPPPPNPFEAPLLVECASSSSSPSSFQRCRSNFTRSGGSTRGCSGSSCATPRSSRRRRSRTLPSSPSSPSLWSATSPSATPSASRASPRCPAPSGSSPSSGYRASPSPFPGYSTTRSVSHSFMPRVH